MKGWYIIPMEQYSQAPAGFWGNIKHNIKSLFTLDYYKEGFSGWTRQSRVWWVIGIIVLLTTGFAHGFDSMTIISVIGGLIGFSCTLAITNNRKLNGILGFVSAILISYVAFHAGNYADIFMQSGYVIFLDIPVILFGMAWQNKKIKTMDKQGWLILIIGLLAMFGLLYFIDTHVFVSPRPVIDAFSAAVGFTGAFLMLGKYSSQYWMWTIQGGMSILLWGVTAFQGDANFVLFMTYILYMGNDILGLFFSPWSARKIK